MTPEEVQALLTETDAMFSGHFKLSSGRHSDLYVQKQRVLEHPAATARLGSAIADQWRGEEPTVVVAPALGAITLGFATAQALGTRFLFAERADGQMQLRRGQQLHAGDRILVVEDVVTTGGSVVEVLEAITPLAAAAGATHVGTGVLVDRSGGASAVPFTSLLTVPAESWAESDCPLCAAGTPLESPGSRFLPT